MNNVESPPDIKKLESRIEVLESQLQGMDREIEKRFHYLESLFKSNQMSTNEAHRIANLRF